MGMGQAGEGKGVPFGDLFGSPQLANRLCEKLLTFINQAEEITCRPKSWVHLDHQSAHFLSFRITLRLIEATSKLSVDHKGERIAFRGCPQGGETLIQAAESTAEQTMPLPCCRVIRINFNGALEIGFGSRPIEIVKGFDSRKGCVG